ncbi:MAG TPA: hypothetical protein ENK21_09635 [Trueperaceae bacterium]|nr:hypothetical protein [Trueperaceae bacterium]
MKKQINKLFIGLALLVSFTFAQEGLSNTKVDSIENIAGYSLIQPEHKLKYAHIKEQAMFMDKNKTVSTQLKFSAESRSIGEILKSDMYLAELSKTLEPISFDSFLADGISQWFEQVVQFQPFRLRWLIWA